MAESSQGEHETVAGATRPSSPEEHYRELSKRLSVILEGVSDGVTAQDAEGRLVFANTAAATACGFASVAELMSATPSQIVDRFEMLDEAGVQFPAENLPGRRALRGEQQAEAIIRVRERSSRNEWWSKVQATCVLDEAGVPILAINVWHDITEQRRREQHEAFLTRATATLSQSLDYGETLTALAGVLVPGLADWCSIHLLEGDELQNVVVAHVDPKRVSQAREFHAKYPPDPNRARGPWQVLRTGCSELYPEISDELLQQSAQDEQHLQLMRSVNMRSVMIVPIRHRERLLGTISLISSESAQRYNQADLALTEELGRRIGSAIEHARLFAAEGRARERLTLLARAGEAFSSSLAYEQILYNVVQIALPELGDFAFFDVVEGDQVRRVAASHDDPQTERLVRQTHWVKETRKDVNWCALSTGASCLHPRIDDAWLRNVAHDSEQLQLLQTHGLCSMISVPMRVNHTLAGSLTFCFGKSRRSHTRDDLELAEELARRAGIAVTQARLFIAAQDAARIAKSAAQSAEEASRVKDDFLATVSHELRTPLTAILGWAALLGERCDESYLHKGIEVIHRNAMAQSKIIEDILDMSRIVAGKLRLEPRAMNAVSVVRDAIEVIRPSASAKRISIELTSEGDGTLVADPERLQQAVWNLLSNAAKFTGIGGQIKIAVRQQGSQMTIAVSDTGSGIVADLLPFVFDRFKQGDSSTTRRVGGLGLGLAIVRHIVELHGGRVLVASPGLDRGSTFTIVLPIRRVDSFRSDVVADEECDPLSNSRVLLLRGLRILVVDDEDDARDLIQTVLQQAGATVETAASAEAALVVLCRFRPDVLLSDIGMPDQDGISLMKRVRALADEQGGSTPAIAFTAYAREEDKLRAIAAGFTTHLGKPVDIDYLISTVASVAGVTGAGAVPGNAAAIPGVTGNTGPANRVIGNADPGSGVTQGRVA